MQLLCACATLNLVRTVTLGLFSSNETLIFTKLAELINLACIVIQAAHTAATKYFAVIVGVCRLFYRDSVTK
jgi:hypothetical protein